MGDSDAEAMIAIIDLPFSSQTTGKLLQAYDACHTARIIMRPDWRTKSNGPRSMLEAV